MAVQFFQTASNFDGKKNASEFNRPLAPTSLGIHLENHTCTLEIKHLSASKSSRKFGRNNFTKGSNQAQKGIKATQALNNTHLC